MSKFIVFIQEIFSPLSTIILVVKRQQYLTFESLIPKKSYCKIN